MTILAIDIGNSTVTIGLFLEGDLRKKLSLPTHPYGTLEEYQDEVRAFLNGKASGGGPWVRLLPRWCLALKTS